MTLSTVCVIVALLNGNLSPKEALRSGPPVGSENDRSGFRPQIVTGPSAGQRLCPV